MGSKPFAGFRISVSVLLLLAALCAAALGALGYFGILFRLELWLAVYLCAAAVVTLVLWIWFVCVSDKICENMQTKD